MREIWPGHPSPRGATYDGAGVNFSVYSRVATRIEVCLYDPAAPAKEVERARRVLEAMDQARKEGKGAVSLDGRLIDIASIKQAEAIVAMAEMIAGVG